MADVHEVDVAPIVPETASTETYSIHLPVSKELAEEILDVGDRVHISATGIVKELSSGYMDTPDYSMRLDIKKVSVETENEFEQLSKDDD
jgi:hypothetical protein